MVHRSSRTSTHSATAPAWACSRCPPRCARRSTSTSRPTSGTPAGTCLLIHSILLPRLLPLYLDRRRGLQRLSGVLPLCCLGLLLLPLRHRFPPGRDLGSVPPLPSLVFS